jgi:single-strand DNA-binding protein
MATSLNRVHLIGYLGTEVELRFTPQGTPVANFRVATNHNYKTTDGELHEETEWTPVVVWRKLAELCAAHLRKGSRVYVEGRLQTRSWQDEANLTHYRTEVLAEEVIFLDGRGQAAGGLVEEDLPDTVET